MESMFTHREKLKLCKGKAIVVIISFMVFSLAFFLSSPESFMAPAAKPVFSRVENIQQSSMNVQGVPRGVRVQFSEGEVNVSFTLKNRSFFVISTKLFHVKPEALYKIIFYLQKRNVKDVKMKIQFLNEQNRFIGEYFFFDDPPFSLNRERHEIIILTLSGANKASLVLNVSKNSDSGCLTLYSLKAYDFTFVSPFVTYKEALILLMFLFYISVSMIKWVEWKTPLTFAFLSALFSLLHFLTGNETLGRNMLTVSTYFLASSLLIKIFGDLNKYGSQ